MAGRLFGAFVSVLLVIFGFAIPANAGAPLGKPFLLVRTPNTSMFDDQLVDFYSPRAGMVVLNLPLKGNAPGYSLASVVKRFHARSPRLPILLYAWATRWTDAKGNLGTLIGKGFPQAGAQLFRTVQERSHYRGPKDRTVYYANPGSVAFRSWLLGRLRHALNTTSADGFMFDYMERTPRFLRKPCARGQRSCESYHRGVDKLIASLAKGLAPNFVIINGLKAGFPGQLENGLLLLRRATGAQIEFFGRNPRAPVPPFSSGVQAFLDAIQTRPQKTFLVSARGSWKWDRFKVDYEWQRYLYCAYLMVAGRRTHFHYSSSFGVPSPGRADAVAWYADWDLPLGAPAGPYQIRHGLYVRLFTDGLVVMNPAGNPPRHFALPSGTWYTPEGAERSGPVTIPGGTGALFISEKVPAKSIDLDLGSDRAITADWPEARVRSDGDQHYLALTLQPQGARPQHDLLIDPVRALDAPLKLSIRYRTSDRKAEVIAVAETDTRDAVFVAAGQGAAGVTEGKGKTPEFRKSRSGRNASFTDMAGALSSDGQWHTLHVGPSTADAGAAAGTLRRWIFVRFSGNIDIAWVHARH